MKVTYTSETLAVLESLQIQAETRNRSLAAGRRLDTDRMAEKLERNCSTLTNTPAGIDSTVDFYRSYQNRLPTQHEDPVNYPQTVVLFEKVAEAAAKLGYDLPETVSIGTVPSGDLNAHLISVDRGETHHLLVLNRQVFLFNELFVRYIACLIANEVKGYSGKQTLVPRKPTDTEIKKLDEVIYYLINRIEFHRGSTGGINFIMVLDKEQVKIPIIHTDAVATAFKEMMLVPMAAFVIAHEVAHIHLQHKRGLGELLDVDTVFEQELFCDKHGVRIAAQTATDLYKGLYPQGWQKFATVSPILFLSCLDIAHKAAYVMRSGRTPPQIMLEVDTSAFENNRIESHPTTLLRLSVAHALLRYEIERAFAPKPADWVFENCDWIDAFFVEGWNMMEEFYLKRHATRKMMLDHVRSLRDKKV